MLNSTSRNAGLHILYSFEANGSKRSQRTHIPATVHPKEKSQTSEFLASRFQFPASRFQIPGSRFWILGRSPYKDVKPNDPTK